MTNDLEQYVSELHTVDCNSDKKFQELLIKGIDLLKLDDKALAHQFGASRPTIARWKDGSNAPHPSYRKHIYAFLLEQALALNY